MSWLVHLSVLSSLWVPLTHLDCFHALTCLSMCALQNVSAPHLLRLFMCPELFVCLCSLACECPLLAQIVSMPWLVCLSVLSSMWVPLTCSDCFCALTCLSVCALQHVSAPCLLRFFPCPDLSVHLCSPACECPLLTQILSMSWLVHLSVLSRQWVPLLCLLYMFSLLSFSAPKPLLSKLSSFFAKVLLLFYRFISLFYWHTFSHPFCYLVMITYITN